MRFGLLSSSCLVFALALGVSACGREQAPVAAQAAGAGTSAEAAPVTSTPAPMPGGAFAVLPDSSVPEIPPQTQVAGGAPWLRFAFSVGDARRYLALATIPPTGPDAGRPQAQATLAQTTYRWRDGAWQPSLSQADIGRFGSSGEAPPYDDTRSIEGVAYAASRALVALPTRDFQNGAELSAYQVLDVDLSTDTWRLLGKIDAGADYSATCSDGPSTPALQCVRNHGSLSFETAEGDAMPRIRISLGGSRRDDSGEIRLLPEGYAELYRYDADAARFSADPAP